MDRFVQVVPFLFLFAGKFPPAASLYQDGQEEKRAVVFTVLIHDLILKSAGFVFFLCWTDLNESRRENGTQFISEKQDG